ncbi:hypothetical protein GCM10025779_30430 [Arthrobacter cryoconiti]
MFCWGRAKVATAWEISHAVATLARPRRARPLEFGDYPAIDVPTSVQVHIFEQAAVVRDQQ